MSEPIMNPWHPMTDSVDLKHLGKLAEELGELSAAVARCIIQGIDENEPVTGKANRAWIEEEISDVMANMSLVISRFRLDPSRISERMHKKVNQLKSWHDMA